MSRSLILEMAVRSSDEKPVIELKDGEFLESIEWLTSHQAYTSSEVQISPYSFDLIVQAVDPSLSLERTILDDNGNTQVLLTIPDGGSAFYLLDTDVTKKLPRKIRLISSNFSDPAITQVAPQFAIVRVNIKREI